MRIVKTEPLEKAADPTIVFNLEEEADLSTTMPLRVEGLCYTSDGTLLGQLFQFNPISSNVTEPFKLKAQSYGTRRERNQWFVSLALILSTKGINKIEELRTKNKKGDVALSLKVRILWLEGRFIVPNLLLAGSISQNYPSYDFLVRRRDNPQSNLEAYPDIKLIATEQQDHVLQLRYSDLGLAYTIPGGDWVIDFREKMNLGSSILFDIPVIKLPEVIDQEDKKFVEHINEAYNTLRKLEVKINEADWKGVIVEARGIVELLRREIDSSKSMKEVIKDLLIKDSGITDEFATHFVESLDELFSYLSATHKKDRTGEIVKASFDKEDAYLAYVLSIALLNLVSRKYNKVNTGS